MIQSELGGGQHGLLGILVQKFTYQTVTGNECVRPTHLPQEARVPPNSAKA